MTPSASPAPSESTESSESSKSSESSAPGDQASDDGVPPWVWWLLAALVAAAAVVVPLLVVRARRRHLWRERFESAQAEVAWMAREFLPQLRDTASLERMAGGWQVGLPRVAALEDQLTVLGSSTKNQDDAGTARMLRDAARTAHARVDSVIAEGANDTWALALNETVALLESALAGARQSR